jgi:hypothetical protein
MMDSLILKGKKGNGRAVKSHSLKLDGGGYIFVEEVNQGASQEEILVYLLPSAKEATAGTPIRQRRIPKGPRRLNINE